MSNLFPWVASGHFTSRKRLHWVVAKCLVLNAIHLAVYVAVAALVLKAVIA